MDKIKELDNFENEILDMIFKLRNIGMDEELKPAEDALFDAFLEVYKVRMKGEKE